MSVLYSRSKTVTSHKPSHVVVSITDSKISNFLSSATFLFLYILILMPFQNLLPIIHHSHKT